MKKRLGMVLRCVFLYVPSVFAEQGLKALTVSQMVDGKQEYSVTLEILFLMTALSFLPAMVIMLTSFTRIVVVLAILRQAIGLQQTPSNQILLGLSFFIFFYYDTGIRRGLYRSCKTFILKINTIL